MAVAAPIKEFILPCGACLQVLAEFSDDLPLILVNADLKIKKTSLKRLLTSPFRSMRK
jgi:cytidine deaminase